MKRILFPIFLLLGFISSYAQNYSIMSEGVDNNGKYVVKIVVSTKKKPLKSAEELIRKYAVHGVLFSGVTAANDYNGYPALIKDSQIETTKKAWFDAFWDGGSYKQFVSIVPSSLSVIKNKQTKMIETSAIATVSGNELKNYLEEEGIIKGLSNLW